MRRCENDRECISAETAPPENYPQNMQKRKINFVEGAMEFFSLFKIFIWLWGRLNNGEGRPKATQRVPRGVWATCCQHVRIFVIRKEDRDGRERQRERERKRDEQLAKNRIENVFWSQPKALAESPRPRLAATKKKATGNVSNGNRDRGGWKCWRGHAWTVNEETVSLGMPLCLYVFGVCVRSSAGCAASAPAAAAAARVQRFSSRKTN